MNFIDKLPNNSFKLIKLQNEKEVEAVIAEMENFNALIIRDVIIDSNPQANERSMLAENGDFWFHTDGVFFEESPHWVIIQLLKSEQGGEIELINLNDVPSLYHSDLYFFGKDDTGVSSQFKQNNVFRYRKDYMKPLENYQNFIDLNDQIDNISQSKSINIGKLNFGDCLLIDNWQLAHRRKSFGGHRVIRRIWLT